MNQRLGRTFIVLIIERIWMKDEKKQLRSFIQGTFGRCVNAESFQRAVPGMTKPFFHHNSDVLGASSVHHCHVRWISADLQLFFSFFFFLNV